jgi:hypothetical protein
MFGSKLSRGSDYPEFFRGFPQYLKADAGIVPQLGYDGFLPNHFQFIVPSVV